ncbi:MAG: hypothetical protein RBR88_04490, partial [Candidatus Saccharicenans sp.]|nr:hypothetical protein [Candidatus Saccharicenans sp.]
TGKMIIREAHPSLPRLKTGEVLDTIFFEEFFEITDKKAQVLAESQDGRPMLVLSPYGKGQALIAGSFLGAAYHHFGNQNNGKFLTGLADWLGIRSQAEVKTTSKDSMVENRWLLSQDYQLLFVFNRKEEIARAGISFDLPWTGVEIRNLETEEKVPYTINKNKASFQIELGPSQVKVFLLRKI